MGNHLGLFNKYVCVLNNIASKYKKLDGTKKRLERLNV